MLTSVSCITSAGTVTDLSKIELYSNFLGGTNEQKSARRQKNTENLNLKIDKAQVLKIKKEVFLKLIGSRMNTVLSDFAKDKMKFLKSRVNYLKNNSNENL